MRAGALQWFLHDSRTAQLVRAAVHSKFFADCPFANTAMALTLATAVAAIAAVLSGAW